MFKIMFAAVAVAIAGVSGTALASPVSFTSDNSNSTSNLGSFSGTVNYVVTSPTAGQLTLSLTNTTPASVGGFLTGVAVVNNQYAGLSVALASTTDADFTFTGSSTNASPYGTFRGGAALGANWSGGGSPAAGIAPGGAITLSFNITGTGAGVLTSAWFVGGDDCDATNMVVRFRGFGGGGSDKVPTLLVPTPGAAGLAGVGLLASARRRRW